MLWLLCAKRAVFTIDGTCDCDTEQFVLVDEKGQTYECPGHGWIQLALETEQRTAGREPQAR